ncbi:MAG: hypothetical protein JXB03_04155 [Spirochaetales bacterium]|nr:hypothetical protein [Spirochaetales bacterium]
MNEFSTWVQESPLAKNIDIQTRIILFEDDMSKTEMIAAADKPLILDRDTLKKRAPFALEVGGKIVGRGRIEKRFGSHYFKLVEIEEENP